MTIPMQRVPEPTPPTQQDLDDLLDVVVEVLQDADGDMIPFIEQQYGDALAELGLLEPPDTEDPRD